MYDLEGINGAASDSPRNKELSEVGRDYFKEVIPTETDWNGMSEAEKANAWNLIESRMQEVGDMTGVCEAEIAKHIPQYIFEETLAFEESPKAEFPYCDLEELASRSEFAVSDFWGSDPYRDIPYADADVNLREDYMEDFYDNYSEFTGCNARLVFEKLPIGECGSYNDRTNVITLNSRLLENSNPEEAMKTILHESRHAFQHYAIEHPDRVSVDMDTISVWKENDEYYIRPEWDFEAYVNQPLEVDAEEFAQKSYNVGVSYIS